MYPITDIFDILALCRVVNEDIRRVRRSLKLRVVASLGVQLVVGWRRHSPQDRNWCRRCDDEHKPMILKPTIYSDLS